jgi:SAM-dependent methyltransferase
MIAGVVAMERSERPKTRHRKRSSAVSEFIRRQYGIGLRDIYSKLRARLLEEMDQVPCNLCGSDQFVVVAEQDKYKLPLKTVMCRQCGLLYLNPRPTAAAYRKHYEQGGQEDSTYHRRVDFATAENLLKIYFGPDFVMDEKARAAMAKFKAAQVPSNKAAKAAQPPEQRLDYYGTHLYEQVKDYVPVGGKVFEPGASWGKMLLPWKVLHRCEVSGVEPKAASVRSAKERLGIDLIEGFADDPRIPEDTFDLVFNTRTINHMLNPLGDLRNAWRWLKPDGILLVDIADAIEEARHEGFERNVVEIDHPYMFSINTLSAMVQKAGFVIVKKELCDLQSVRDWDDRPPQVKQIRIIARKTTDPIEIAWPAPLAELAALSRAQLAFDRGQAAAVDRMRARERKRGWERLGESLQRKGEGIAAKWAQRLRRWLSSPRGGPSGKPRRAAG